MSSLCEEHTHLYNLPPRKLLNRSKEPPPCFEEGDPYSGDEFRMYEFKIRRCMRSRSHDWTDCPFAHPGEKARRRDPRRFHYSGNPCADFRNGSCPRGDACEFAHGVFECWLHPARYRTHACKDGRSCTRKVCFFAHTPRQLRILPVGSESSECSSPSSAPTPTNSCCSFCHMVSPTSTLMGMSHCSHSSPPTSPNLSPPITPNKDGVKKNKGMSYKNAFMELINALDDVNLGSPLSHLIQQQQIFLSPTSSKAKGYDIVYDQDNNGPDLGWVNELVK